MGRALHMTGMAPTRKATQPDGFTKWLRSGGLLQRWWKEALITAPVVAVMAIYGFMRYRVDFSWPIYLVATILISAGVALYFAIVSIRKFPERKAVLDPAAPIEPK
jgi:protein-S-isoprenylcysteine O-methyltransferase Ste14